MKKSLYYVKKISSISSISSSFTNVKERFKQLQFLQDCWLNRKVEVIIQPQESETNNSIHNISDLPNLSLNHSIDEISSAQQLENEFTNTHLTTSQLATTKSIFKQKQPKTIKSKKKFQPAPSYALLNNWAEFSQSKGAPNKSSKTKTHNSQAPAAIATEARQTNNFVFMFSFEFGIFYLLEIIYISYIKYK